MCCIFHPVWPALEAWCHKSQPMSGALGHLQVPGQGGQGGGKCHHLWRTGCGSTAPSSRARSSRQHSMVHTDWFHLFCCKVTEETPWLPRTPAGWGRGHGPSQVLLLFLPTLSPSCLGLSLPGPYQLSLHRAGACSSVESELQGSPYPSAPACAFLSNPSKADLCISSQYHSVPGANTSASSSARRLSKGSIVLWSWLFCAITMS